MAGRISKTNKDISYVFESKDNLNDKQKKRRKRGISVIFGLILVIIQLIATFLFALEIIELDMLPMEYLAIVLLVLGLLLIYNLISQLSKAHMIGKLLAVVLSAIMLVGYVAGDKLNNTFSKLTGDTYTSTNVIDIVVLKKSSAQSINDILDETIGYNSNAEGTLIRSAFEEINKQYNCQLSTKGYTNWTDLVDKLYAGKEYKAIAISSNMRDYVTEQYEDFAAETKIIHSITVTKQVTNKKANVVKKNAPFVIYISGSDSYGTVTDIGRSDVNLLAVINPETRQVLLISTPRDFRVPLSRVLDNGTVITGKDKLTHAGNSGIQYSMEALSNLYGVNIDYYYKINFSGCINIIDALGGITINSAYDFTNGWEAAPVSYHFVQGPNECDGAKTLAFVRERKVLPEGDISRGKNQQAAIAGMIEKATSPSILKNYSAVLDAVADMMITNMPMEAISNLIKAQLSDSTPWNIQSFTPDYTKSGMMELEVFGGYASCLEPNYNDINLAIRLISKIENDEIFSIDEYVAQERALYDTSHYTYSDPNYVPPTEARTEAPTKAVSASVNASVTAATKKPVSSSVNATKKPEATEEATTKKSSTTAATTKPGSQEMTTKKAAAGTTQPATTKKPAEADDMTEPTAASTTR